MKTRTIKLAMLLVLFLAAIGGSAQMTSHYSSYDNVTTTSDSSGHLSTVTVTLTLQGYTQWNCCYPPAKHTGNVNVTFGGVSSSNTTGQVNPNYNMNVSTSVTLSATDDCFNNETGCLLSADSGEVICSLSGVFFSGAGSWWDKLFRIGITNYIHNGNTSNSCTYDLFCPNGNSAATCKLSPVYFVPDDDNLALCQNYLVTEDLVVGGVCTEIGTAVSTSVALDCD